MNILNEVKDILFEPTEKFLGLIEKFFGFTENLRGLNENLLGLKEKFLGPRCRGPPNVIQLSFPEASPICNMISEFSIPESPFRNSELGIQNPDSGIRDPHSGFRNGDLRYGIHLKSRKRRK